MFTPIYEGVSVLTVGIFFWTTVLMTFPAVTEAQPRPGDNRMRVYRFDTVHGPDVADMMALRIEEFYKAILEVNSQVHLLMEEDLIIGIAPEAKPEQSNPNLEKADELLWQGKEKVERGKHRKAVSLLEKAIKLYKQEYIDLVDYDKMVDAYLQLAIAQYKQGYKDNSRETMDSLIVLRPDTRVDPRIFDSEFIEMLEGARQRAQSKTTGQVYVTSEPMGADVFIDGIPVGKAPSTLSGVLRGKHYLQVKSDGMKTFGKVVDVSGSTSLVTVTANLAFDGDQEMAEIDGEYVPPDTLIPYKDTGDFGANFKRAARYFCSKAYVNYLLYSYIAKGEDGFDLHLFLYDAQRGEIAELGPVSIKEDLSDLQIKLLETEQVFVRGLSAFPMDRIIQDPPPAVYRIDRQKAMAGVTPESAREKRAAAGIVAVTPGSTGSPYGSAQPAPSNSMNQYGSGSSSSGASSGMSPQATNYGQRNTFGNSSSTGAGQAGLNNYGSGQSNSFDSYSSANGSGSGLGVYDTLGQDKKNEWYEEWWVWTIVGVGVAGAGVGAYFLIDGMNQPQEGPAFTGTVVLP